MFISKSKKSALELLESRTLYSGTAPAVMGYLPDYEIGNSNSIFAVNGNGAVSTDNVDWKALTQVNYFALLPTSTGALATDPNTGSIVTSSGYDPSTQLPAIVSDAKSHNVKVVVTVGGGDTGKSIPAMNALVNSNQAAWTNFAAQLKTFASNYGLSGVDLDWEPTSTTTTAIENFGTLVKTIKQADPGLTLSTAVLGDPVATTDNNSQSYTLDATAVQYLDDINVMAYEASPSEAKGYMSDWASYITGGQKDLTGATVAGKLSQLQYGIEVDSTNTPSGVVEAKVDTAVNADYGGDFVWTLTEDTGSSILSRIGAEVIKDTGTTAPSVGSVSGSVKTSNGTAVPNVTVYLDANNNAKLDSGELSTTTISAGAYSFASVPAGAYILRQVLPSGDTQTTPSGGTGIHITVAKGGSLTNANFVDTVPNTTPAGGAVSGTVKTSNGTAVPNVTVYLDANNNSKLDSGELSTVTTSTGTYSFANVTAGAYILRQVLPSGDTQTTPSGGTGIHITVAKGGSLTNENFVDTVPTAATGGAVSGSVKTSSGAAVPNVTVYLDANNNSKLDSGERSTTSSSTGTYSFANVPAAAYILRQVLPSDDTQTTPSGGLGIHITVTKGGNLTNENFVNTVKAAAAELTGTVIGSTNALQHATSGHSAANAFDNNVNTVFEDQNASDNWVGLDLGKAHTITQIKFAADPANPSFMEGGIFQASSTADFSSNVANLYQVPNTSAPSTSLTTVNVNVSGSYRYVRYLAPAGAFGDIAEADFYGV